jgi:hypothetical protein
LVRNASDGTFSAPLMFLLSQLIAFALGTRFGSVLPPGFAGAAMALSVVYVAAENLLLKEITHRGWIGAFFGLIYGFAFAELLQAAGLPPKGTLTALICYQLGIALVAAGLVASTLVLAAGFKRLSQPRHAVVVASWHSWHWGFFGLCASYRSGVVNSGGRGFRRAASRLRIRKGPAGASPSL